MTEAIPQLDHSISRADTLGMWKVRWGIGRTSYRVEPGLYRLGTPDETSPILVTCNYKYTVDLMRRDTPGVDAWLLVLETFGVNVWCAAGKRTFGTKELIRRILASELPLVAESQTLILPQLGAVGVAAHEVRAATGYRVVYGPVRLRDIPAYLAEDMRATPAMRQVTFTLQERLELAPVEFVGSWRWAWWAIPTLVVLATLAASLGAHRFVPLVVLMSLFSSLSAYALATVAGGVLVPMLLPYLPGRAFSVKGAVVGAVVALLALAALPRMFGMLSIWQWFAMILGIGAFASYIAVNFTGSTPYTSPSGVEYELRRAIPWQAAALAVAVVCWVAAWYTRIGGL